MSLNELLPIFHELPRADKVRLIQFLVFELAKEDDVTLLDINGNYPIWSPYNAFEAADTSLEALEQDKVE